MKLLSLISDFFNQIKQIESESKRNLILSAATLVTLYIAYPVIRSSTTAIFLDIYGAKKSPEVWIYSVLLISIVISVFSWLQKKWSAQALFFSMAFLTSVLLFIFTYLFQQGMNVMAYPLYVWKEVYIVILVHLTLAFINNCIDLNIAKLVYGPLGAIGSIGGIIGGLVTAKLSGTMSVETLMYLSAVMVLISGLVFLPTSKTNIKAKAVQSNVSPLKSLKGVGKYVFMICALIAVTQFCINLATYQFNVLFEKMVEGTSRKVETLGLIFSSINAVSFVIQIVITPILLKKLSLTKIHIGIPLFLSTLSLTVMAPMASLMTLSVMFVGYKAMDYSLFASVKELLYFPLNEAQKYGAKYLADMLVYRLAKGLISAILLYIQTELMVNILLLFFLGLWIAILIPLLNERKKLNQLIDQK
jgi:AAA family ATP:ADP antiporter